MYIVCQNIVRQVPYVIKVELEKQMIIKDALLF